MSIQNDDQAAFDKACDAYNEAQVKHGMPDLSTSERQCFEAGWEAAMEFVKQSPQGKRKSKKVQIEEALRRSDLTAQLADRQDIEYGHHDQLPRGEHVARMKR